MRDLGLWALGGKKKSITPRGINEGLVGDQWWGSESKVSSGGLIMVLVNVPKWLIHSVARDELLHRTADG
jgi:hypothetical protein